MANHKVIKKKNTFVKVYKDTIWIPASEDLNFDKTSGILAEDGVNISKARLLTLNEINK